MLDNGYTDVRTDGRSEQRQDQVTLGLTSSSIAFSSPAQTLVGTTTSLVLEFAFLVFDGISFFSTLAVVQNNSVSISCPVSNLVVYFGIRVTARIPG